MELEKLKFPCLLQSSSLIIAYKKSEIILKHVDIHGTLSTDQFPRLDKTAFSVHSLTDDLSDKDYWLSKSPEERLAHVEMLRTLNYGDLASSRLKDFLKLLNLHDVDYLLIGGYAVGFYGKPR